MEKGIPFSSVHATSHGIRINRLTGNLMISNVSDTPDFYI
jgi:hypothetical protein